MVVHGIHDDAPGNSTCWMLVPAGGGGTEQRHRQRVSPPHCEAAPPSPDPQHCDVVLSPVFSQEELDMLLEALSQPSAGECKP